MEQRKQKAKSARFVWSVILMLFVCRVVICACARIVETRLKIAKRIIVLFVERRLRRLFHLINESYFSIFDSFFYFKI